MCIKLVSSTMGALIPRAIIKCDLTSNMWGSRPHLCLQHDSTDNVGLMQGMGQVHGDFHVWI